MPAHKKHPTARAGRRKVPGAATLQARSLQVVPEPGDYSGFKAAELRELVEQRNGGRSEGDQISKSGTKAQLIARLQADDITVEDETPPLPNRIDGWTEQTRAWWADVWSSPMSAEWDDSDMHNVYICALLFDDMWTAETAKARKDAASEFRLQCARLGLDPYARRRLEWQIEAVQEAQDRGKKRRQGQAPAEKPRVCAKKPDPRAAFSVVN